MVKINEKTIGSFKAKFKTIFNREENDSLILKFSISEDLRKLILKCVLKDKTEGSYRNSGEYIEFKRFKVFTAFYSMLGNKKDILFSVDLLEKKEFDLLIDNAEKINSFREDIKYDLKILISSILKYSEIDETITFNLKK